MTLPKDTTSGEIKKLKMIMKKVPKERLPVAEALFNELEFMQKTLVILKAQVDKEGPTSMFKQGRQEFIREHPALRAYNTTIQRYSLLYKQLTALLPAAVEKPKADPLLDFIKK